MQEERKEKERERGEVQEIKRERLNLTNNAKKKIKKKEK